MRSAVTLQVVEAQSLPALCGIYARLAGESALSLAATGDWFSRGSLAGVLAVGRDGEPIGFVCAVALTERAYMLLCDGDLLPEELDPDKHQDSDADYWFITGIGVDEQRRGKGVGRGLLDALLEEVGHVTVVADVPSAGGVGLMRGAGFSPCPDCDAPLWVRD